MLPLVILDAARDGALLLGAAGALVVLAFLARVLVRKTVVARAQFADWRRERR